MNRDYILVVDDNREILTTIGALLEQEGYRVEFAFDGEEALEKIAIDAPDLILTDIFMPGMGGLELADALKRDPRSERIPILAMSAIEEYETGEPRQDLHADDFIRKPPAKQELLDKVEALLRRDRQPSCGEISGCSASPAPGPTVEKGSPLSERLCQLIAENSFDWQMLVAQSDRVLYCSPSSQRVTGYDPGQFAADPELWNTIVHPLDRDLWRNHRKAARAFSHVDELQFRIVTKDGMTKWIGHVCVPIRDEDGLFLGTLSSNRDISDRKAMEARLLRVQRLQTVGALTGGVAHDLNNVLTPIILGIEVLRESITDEASRRLFESMERSARRGADLVHQVMKLTRSGDWDGAVVQVRPLVSEIEKIVRETFPPAIRFSVRIPGDIWCIAANPVVVPQVLMNLCLASRDALPQGGSVEITAENTAVPERPRPESRGPQAGQHVLLSVRHGGMASPKEPLLRRSEAHGADAHKPSASDWAATTTLVRQHGGFLDVVSEAGGGATFKISFPAVPPPLAVETVENAAPPPEGNGELLLLVDDEGVVREATRVVLEGHGYRILCADSGADALAVYADRWPEIALVLTDLMMPLMDGHSTMVAIKKINHRAKVIAMSGLARKEGRTDDVGREFAAFLPKPFSVAQLLQTIDDVVRQ